MKGIVNREFELRENQLTSSHLFDQTINYSMTTYKSNTLSS